MTEPPAGPPSGVVLVTDRGSARRPLPDLVAAAVDGGVRWVLLRERDLPYADRAALADVLRAVLAPAGGRLIVAGADPLGGDAVHLPSAGPYPPPDSGLVGRSCHDRAELRRLTTEHYATLSPVFPTASKPGYGPPLTPAGLAALIADAPLPVLALGGVDTPERVARCVAAGAAGVAVMGAVMRAPDPGRLVRELCAASGPGGATRPAAPARSGLDGAGSTDHVGMRSDSATKSVRSGAPAAIAVGRANVGEATA